MAKNRQSIVDVWQRAGMVQRIALLSLLLAVVGAGALLVNWARRPNLTLLYSGLAPQEASKIVDKIRDADVPYELKSGGTAIYVPESEAYSLRLTMASQGMPTGGPTGYKILDEENLGTSPFTQRVNYRRAIEGELARTIQMLDGVVSARVHVARPEPSLFAGRAKDASATVALRLRAGCRLSASNVAAVVHLVAGSIEGLTAEKVVVVDSQGNLLSSQSHNELAKGSNSFLEYKTRIEGYLARKAEDMLTAVLGPNRASVRVDATIETSSLNHTKESYNPDEKVVEKEELKSKSSQPAAGAGGGAAAAGTREETTLTEYLVTKTVELKRDMPGKITALSVAAVVDLSGSAKAAEGEEAKPTISLKDAEEIIRQAVGLGDTDSIKVVDAPFQQPAVAAADAEEAGFGGGSFYLEIAKRSSLGLLVFGALVALKLFGGSKKKGGEPALALEAEAAAAGALPAGGEGAPEVLRARITRALQENPEEVRRLFLTWAENDEGAE